MAKVVPNLSKVVVKHYPCFNVRPDLDNVENGVRNYGYDYKGVLDIYTCRTHDVTYLWIDIHPYLNAGIRNFTHNDLIDSGVLDLNFKYNGVSEIDVDDLVATCEEIIRRLDNLNKACENENFSKSKISILKERILKEIGVADRIKALFAQVKWWNMSREDILWLHNIATDIVERQDKLADEYNALKYPDGICAMSIQRKRELLQKFNSFGYVEIKIEEMGNLINSINMFIA